MVALAARLENSDRMIAAARGTAEGIDLAFADGRKGLIPYADLPEIGGLDKLKKVELPNPYELLLHTRSGETIEVPWDFARPYCDPMYRTRVERVGKRGRVLIGERIRGLRLASQLTQEELASRAKIGRVTLVRIENGEQSPRYETLLALAKAMKHDPAELLATS